MTWDEDKSTAVNPDNPDLDQVLTADEWNNHTDDQVRRLQYGQLSNRPAASELPDGALWMDENSDITRVDGSSWVSMSVGGAAGLTYGGMVSDGDTIDTGNAIYVSGDSAPSLTIDPSIENDGTVLIFLGTYFSSSKTLELTASSGAGVGNDFDNKAAIDRADQTIIIYGSNNDTWWIAGQRWEYP